HVDHGRILPRACAGQIDIARQIHAITGSDRDVRQLHIGPSRRDKSSESKESAEQHARARKTLKSHEVTPCPRGTLQMRGPAERRFRTGKGSRRLRKALATELRSFRPMCRAPS